MTEYTSGPWSLESELFANGSEYRIIHSAHGHLITIADLSELSADDHSKANARLISGAPALLNELKSIVRAWERGWKVDPDIYISDAKLAIAKAEGHFTTAA